MPGSRATSRSLAAFPVTLLATLASAQQPTETARPDKPLLIPQVEGERQGKLVGRAIACGLPQERADAALQSARLAMLAHVGGPFTEERYLPALRSAVEFETSLPRPSEAACAKALAAFEDLEGGR